MGNAKKWVIATNGTKYASAALKYAAELYRDLRAEPEVYILVVAIDEDSMDEAKAILEMSKFLFEDIAGKEGTLSPYIKTGEPGKVIVDEMSALNADHLFIGGSDFKWDINEEGPGGISNYIIEHISGRVTLIK